MTNAKIVINDVVEFDGNVDGWFANPPDKFKEALKPGAQNQPWMTATMVIFSDAVMRRQSVQIEVDSSPPSYTGWTMKVKYR